MLKCDNNLLMLILAIIIIMLLMNRKTFNNPETFDSNPSSYYPVDYKCENNCADRYSNQPTQTTPKSAGLINPPRNIDSSNKDDNIERPQLDQIPPSNPQVLFNNISDYDGMCLKNSDEDFWMKSPSNLDLVDNSNLYTIQGHTNPNRPVISDVSALNGPTIDGTDSSPKSLFLLKNNKVSPSCCPSTFSTSSGCVCTTKNQRDFVASRGNNISKSCNL